MIYSGILPAYKQAINMGTANKDVHRRRVEIRTSIATVDNEQDLALLENTDQTILSKYH